MFRTFETTLAGRPLVIETGKMAQLANGHCLVRLRRHSCNGKRNSDLVHRERALTSSL